ncbi:MAG: type II toxin-antitoxin system RelE/ParE family toxin [Bacteroidota bacterium]
MNYRLVLREKALTEIEEGYNWYETQQTGLGEKFLDAILSYAKVILKNPGSFKTTYKNFKEIPIKKFPYLIVYFIDERKNMIVIISVFHTSRNPQRKFRK